MRITLSFVTAVIAAALLASCESNNYSGQQTLMETSKQELALAVQERDRLLALVKEISADLDHIKNMDDSMALTFSHPGGADSVRSHILKDIEVMKHTMVKRRERLAATEQELANSTLNNAELKEIVNALRKQIDSQMAKIETLKQQLLSANRHIAALADEVDSLNTEVVNVTNELDTAKLRSERLENRLNLCYYIVAPKSRLKQLNIIETGFLRNTKLMKGHFDNDTFETGDKRLLRSLPLGSRKARILSNHPEASYVLTAEGDSALLTINNPEQFWSLSNYLVVQID